jgi:hypothetical protein
MASRAKSGRTIRMGLNPRPSPRPRPSDYYIPSLFHLSQELEIELCVDEDCAGFHFVDMYRPGHEREGQAWPPGGWNHSRGCPVRQMKAELRAELRAEWE